MQSSKKSSVEETLAHILHPLLSIKVLLKAACSQSEGLYATFRGTFIDKRGFRIWAIESTTFQSEIDRYRHEI